MRLLGIFALLALTPPLSAQVLNLDQLIDEAIRNNLDLKAERANLSIAEARQITARLRPNPVLSLSWQYLDILGTGFNAINGAGPPEVDVRTDFVLEGGKKRQRRIAVAAEDRKLAELNFRESLRNLILDVQSAYTDVLLRKETLRLAEENRQNFNSLLAINQSRVTAGDLAAVELDRSKIAAMQFENAFRQAQLDLAQARLRLQQVLGRRNPVDDFDVEGDFRRDAFPASRNELVNTALERRPDLAAGRELFIRNQADARLQIANGKIDYTVGTEFRRQYGVTSYGSAMAFFLQAPIPVFNRNQGEIARAQRESDQTKLRIESLTNRIQAEVRSAWQQYETAKDLLTRIEGEMLSRASQVRQTTEYSYRRGEASLVELLDAQRAFNDTRQSYNEARANYTRSLFLMDAITAKTVTEGGFK